MMSLLSENKTEALCYSLDVTTLQGRLITRLDEALERSSGMTLSRADLALSDIVRGVRQRKVTPLLLNNSLKGLILRQEVEGREERRRRIGLQYCEQRTLWRHILAEGSPYILPEAMMSWYSKYHRDAS